MNNVSIFDADALSSLREVLEDDLDELLENFVQYTPPIIEDLIVAAQSCDTEQLASIAHTLKGSSGNLAIHGFSRLCMNIETMARNGQADDVIPLIDRLQNEFAHVTSEIRKLLGK